MIFNDIKLDTISEYICDEAKYPEPCCDVMVESERLTALGYQCFNMEPGTGYIDIYAMIDPCRRFVTGFLIVGKLDDGSQDDIEIKVTSLEDSVEYFRIFEKQGGKEFKNFIAKSCGMLHIKRAEIIAGMVDVVDDFLEDKDVRIPSSDEEMIAAGDDPETNSARIYGQDYDDIRYDFEEAMSISPIQALDDRIRALRAWAVKYQADELDFYTYLHDEGFSLSEIKHATDEAFAEHVKRFWAEHGII